AGPESTPPSRPSTAVRPPRPRPRPWSWCAWRRRRRHRQAHEPVAPSGQHGDMAQAAPQTSPTAPPDDLSLVDAWWRAANYLSVGQIYLLDNPLLDQPLTVDHIKPRLLGH